jgi:hypothetical protein
MAFSAELVAGRFHDLARNVRSFCPLNRWRFDVFNRSLFQSLTAASPLNRWRISAESVAGDVIVPLNWWRISAESMAHLR